MAKLLDQFGREIQVEKKPEMREIAVTTVRDRWSGYPSKGLTPQKLASIFQEADAGDIYRQAELFEEMEEKDTHLYAELQTRKSAVLSFNYDFQPYSESAEDKKIADFVSDIFFSLPRFEDSLLDLLDAIGKGYSLLEPMWAIEGKYAVITDLSWIHPKRAVFYDPGRNMWQKSYEIPRIITEAEPINGEEMPAFKLIYHHYKARSGYDTRAGILRVCAWMYLFKNYSIKDWVAFAEIFGMPIRLGKYDTGASKGDKDALIAAIQSIGTDAAGVISKNTEIEFVETMKNTGTQNIFDTLVNFCDSQMSKAILGQTLTTQEGTSGSYSLGQVHNLVRQDLVRADSESLSKTIRFQAIRPLVGYNFGWDKPLPWFKIMYEPSEDLKMLSEVYKDLSEIGYPLTVEHISERFKVPIPEEGETVLTKPAPQGLPFAMKNRDTSHIFNISKLRINKNMGSVPIFTDAGQQKIDSIIEKTLKEGGISEFKSSLEKIINETTSLEDLQARIIDQFKNVDIDKMKEILTRAILIANLTGRVSV